jgi:flavin-binding protein dodecin
MFLSTILPIDVFLLGVGTSKESFAKAVENAVTEARKTVRGLK